MNAVTRMLHGMGKGGPTSAEELLALLYDELRAIAGRKMAQEAPGHTLQPTALVHEAWLRLSGDQPRDWENRAHFLSAAAEAMRRILVESARRKLRVKRGGRPERVDLEDLPIQAPAADEQVLEVHAALEELAAQDPEKAEIVKLRFFVGLGYEEIAALRGVNEKTIRRHWEAAKVRLFQTIKASG